MADSSTASQRRASAFTLGSASPRRADLLASLGLAFDVETVDIDEAAFVDGDERDPNVIVERIARAKFAAFPIGSASRSLLTADTLVACDGLVLGKPDSPEHLVSMLAQMSGRPLAIATAVCVGTRGEEPVVEIALTRVVLRQLMAVEIAGYVATGVGMDKAGGLALQAQAKPFIESVTGCWSNVLGLPVCVASRLLGLNLTQAADGDTRTGEAVSCSIELCGHHDG